MICPSYERAVCGIHGVEIHLLHRNSLALPDVIISVEKKIVTCIVKKRKKCNYILKFGKTRYDANMIIIHRHTIISGYVARCVFTPMLSRKMVCKDVSKLAPTFHMIVGCSLRSLSVTSLRTHYPGWIFYHT